MRNLVLSAVVAVLFTTTLAPQDAEARRRIFGRRHSSSYSWQATYSSGTNVGVEWTGKTAIQKGDQESAEAEAKEMARREYRGHLFRGGRFRGVGWNYRRVCPTCRPGIGLTLTGDATCKSKSGWWYRVRIWR